MKEAFGQSFTGCTKSNGYISKSIPSCSYVGKAKMNQLNDADTPTKMLKINHSHTSNAIWLYHQRVNNIILTFLNSKILGHALSFRSPCKFSSFMKRGYKIGHSSLGFSYHKIRASGEETRSALYQITDPCISTSWKAGQYGWVIKGSSFCEIVSELETDLAIRPRLITLSAKVFQPVRQGWVEYFFQNVRYIWLY